MSENASCWAALRLWALWIAYAYIALSGWVRMASALASWYWLNFAGVRPGPLYLAITGGFWGVVGLVALVWMILRRPGFRLVGTGAALLFALSYWIDRLFIATNTGAGDNTTFAALMTLLGLAYVVLVLRSPAVFRTARLQKIK